MGGWVALIPVTVNLWWPHAELASLLLGNVCCVPVSATAFLPLSALSANTKANVAHRMSFFLPVRLQAQLQRVLELMWHLVCPNTSAISPCMK